MCIDIWRDPSKSLQAAEAMKLTAKDLLKLGVIDEIISEPLGGAHRDPEEIATNIKNSIIKNLKAFEGFSKEEIYDQRKSKFLQIGRDRGFSKSSNLNDAGLSYKGSSYMKFKSHFTKIPTGLYRYKSSINCRINLFNLLITVAKKQL